MCAKTPKPNPLRARREEEKEERRQAILDAAEQVIAKQGWDQTNFGEIAKRSRLSRSLVYFYFPTREDLFHAIAERGLMELQRRFAHAIASHPTGLEQAMAMGRAYHEFSKDEPLHFEILTRMHTLEADPAAESPQELSAEQCGQQCLGYVAQALAHGVADGSVRRSIGDPRATAVAVWAFTHGLIQLSYQKESLLKAGFGLTAAKSLEHGFMLLRGALAADDTPRRRT